MKSFLAKACAGLFFPIAFASVISHDTGRAEINTVASPRVYPYVVEVFLANGQKDETDFKGLSSNSDLKKIAEELGAKPYTEDRLSVFPSVEMLMGGKITLLRAPVFTIYDGKRKSEVRSWQKTVGEILTEKNIELGDDDKINFSLSTEAMDNMEIRIIRVAITQVKEKQQIDFKVTKKEDKTLDEGKVKIETKGEKGEKTFTYEVRREDGIEVSRKLLNTEITKKPVDELQIIGTKPVITVSCGSRSDIKAWILEAGVKNGVKPNDLCVRMMKESRGNPDSDGGDYKGLFQYEEGFWNSVSLKAGFGGSSIWDAKAQIFTTAWAWSHGLRGRWPKD